MERPVEPERLTFTFSEIKKKVLQVYFAEQIQNENKILLYSRSKKDRLPACCPDAGLTTPPPGGGDAGGVVGLPGGAVGFPVGGIAVPDGAVGFPVGVPGGAGMGGWTPG